MTDEDRPVGHLAELVNSAPKWPCLSEHNDYAGCVGLAACAALGTVTCWSGHHLAVDGERLLYEVRVTRYTSAQCATCANVLEVPQPAAGGDDRQLVMCGAGLWIGTCSIYSLHNHRIPLKPEARPPCPCYAPAEELRPELVRQREADKERERARRQRARTAR